MLLQWDDINPPLAPLLAPPQQEQTSMGSHYEETLKELNAKSDEVAFLNAQRNDRDAAIQCAEAHIRNTEAALYLEY